MSTWFSFLRIKCPERDKESFKKFLKTSGLRGKIIKRSCFEFERKKRHSREILPNCSLNFVSLNCVMRKPEKKSFRRRLSYLRYGSWVRYRFVYGKWSWEIIHKKKKWRKFCETALLILADEQLNSLGSVCSALCMCVIHVQGGSDISGTISKLHWCIKKL